MLDSSPALSRKEREFLAREADILTALEQLCAQADWRTITIEQVAQKAEIGKGTIYKHFSSKEDMIGALMLGFHEQILQRLQTLPDQGSAFENLKQMFREGLRFAAERPQLRQFDELCEDEHCFQRMSESFQQRHQQLHEAFDSLFNQLFTRGVLEKSWSADAELPKQMAFYALWKGTFTLMNKPFFLGNCSQEQFIEAASQFAVDGLQASFNLQSTSMSGNPHE